MSESAIAAVIAAPAPPIASVLVVDDEDVIRKAWKRMLPEAEFSVVTCPDGEDALRVIESQSVDVMLLDVVMPGVGGMDLLSHVKSRRPEIEVVMMTGYGGVDAAVEAVKRGAYDFLTKPFENIETAVLAVRKAVERKRLLDRTRRLEAALFEKGDGSELVGQSAAMREVFRLIDSVAQSPSSVLIQGESGTGKELVARAIHQRSARRGAPFVAVNCSALTENLLETELFGHVRGAFTGATGAHKGLFEAADGGTLFLDEIGDMPSATQVKLLRALQEGEIKPVGSTETLQVDVRILAASNVDLAEARAKGRFREDLYYRLNVITIYVPPLRERPDDVALLAYHFVRKHAERLRKPTAHVAPEALEALQAYRFPGNVRELENVVERAVVLGRDDTVRLSDLPAPVRDGAQVHAAIESYAHLRFRKARAMALAAFERRYLMEQLRRVDGNISEAARLAGLDRSNFKRIVRRAGVDPEEFRG
jgi:two-component system, NtrC family, response regulator HydG